MVVVVVAVSVAGTHSTRRATILMAQEMAAVRVIADTFW